MTQISNLSNLSVIVALVIAIVGEIAAHYFPWARVMGRELHRVEAYIIGNIIILVSFAAWGAMNGYWIAVAMLFGAMIASGLSVMACRALDYTIAQREAAINAAEQVRLIERMAGLRDAKDEKQ